MFFIDDNTFVLRKGDPLGERVATVAQQKGMLLMMCDMCALERGVRHRANHAGATHRAAAGRNQDRSM
jgi:sulfur relay (sulfurtransferase) complex TusBCD TusD component (DsrE family)